MYNLKVEAMRMIEELKNNNFDAYLIGNYPFVKYNNLIHQDDKLKIKQFSIVTEAGLEDLKNMFNVYKICDNLYNKYVIVETILKQNPVYFRIYYTTNYINVINKKVKSIDTIDKILNEFSFLLDTIKINDKSKILNYTNNKLDAFESIKQKSLQANGNFREKLMTNPLIILETCYYTSNINFTINSSILKIISNNNSYLKYETLSNIIKYFNMILMSKNPIHGIKIIKETMIDFKYNDISIFKFLENIPDNIIQDLSKFNPAIDIMSRWAYLLKQLPKEEYNKIIDIFNINNKNKIIWLIENFDIIKEENYKLAIYNVKDTLKTIDEKYDIFLLHEMFNRLTKIYFALDNTLEIKCSNIINTLYSRPFFEYQLMYDDNEICKIANIGTGDWLPIAKENLVQKILMSDKHPNEEQYLELMKDSIEYSLNIKR